MEEKTQDNTLKGERIAKVLARAGIGSRRAVERMIAAGMVKIDGKIIDTPAMLITSVDGITVDGQKVQEPEQERLWVYHKPTGRLTTYHDPEGRPTIFEALPANMPRVISVGRLDLNTEGLLLLTNDGGLARWLELPSTGWVRTYRVRVNGRFHHKKLEEISKGVTIDGVNYRKVDIELDDRKEGVNQWMTVKIREGKNREVRKLLEYAGMTVTRLLRTSYGPFELGKIQRGSVEEVSRSDLLINCKEYFKDKSVEIPDVKISDKPKAKKAGWAKSKPKKNAKPKRNKFKRKSKEK
ncbi:pseudouridine synthase [Pseudemcibacter aquimaris]|uniref:pseudouridine synthase n=1 Tax=Pseudemcibacter aquimaris TaxID=2857064 RepID=UPI002010FA9B|nr:pseudouridine synthase [Pseudemcibacter aquimaris]MCC3862296.1 rRNA pseudouridine synthase [Pseudemcibacter aquimaris]WDU59044.1 rRNA pseudouridine synthase [Pseudemcibacter aquimaris]